MSAIRSELNKTAKIERATVGSDGIGGVTKSWSTIAAAEPCCMSTIRGGEPMVTGRETVEAMYRVFMLPTADITEKDRITIDGRIMNVTHAEDAESRGSHIELLCTAYK